MQEIMIVEDNPDIHALTLESLNLAGYQTLSAYSGTEALLLLEKHQPDLIILDLMLPGISGNDLLKEIRKTSRIPILVVSARSSVEDKVELLSLGADDYLTKPFDLAELNARILAILRRNTPSENGQQLKTHRDLTLNEETCDFQIREERLNLTRQEFRILELLLSNPNKVFTKEIIFEYAWEEPYYGEDNTINVHISNIRKKLRAHSDQDYIETVWGIGFKLK